MMRTFTGYSALLIAVLWISLPVTAHAQSGSTADLDVYIALADIESGNGARETVRVVAFGNIPAWIEGRPAMGGAVVVRDDGSVSDMSRFVLMPREGSAPARLMLLETARDLPGIFLDGARPDWSSMDCANRRPSGGRALIPCADEVPMLFPVDFGGLRENPYRGLFTDVLTDVAIAGLMPSGRPVARGTTDTDGLARLTGAAANYSALTLFVGPIGDYGSAQIPLSRHMVRIDPEWIVDIPVEDVDVAENRDRRRDTQNERPAEARPREAATPGGPDAWMVLATPGRDTARAFCRLPGGVTGGAVELDSLDCTSDPPAAVVSASTSPLAFAFRACLMTADADACWNETLAGLPLSRDALERLRRAADSYAERLARISAHFDEAMELEMSGAGWR